MNNTSNTSMQAQNAAQSPTQSRKLKFSEALETQTYKDLMLSALGSEAVVRRVKTAILAAVSINPKLQECTPASILACALIGESLQLSPSPQLGQYYPVPYESKAKFDKATNRTIEEACSKAQFQMGYKGYIQLALRSGQYRKLNVIEIRKGELISWNPLTEDIRVNIELDDDKRAGLDVIGYYIFFETVNGFTKSMYWSKAKVMRHADRYSPAFSAKAYADIQAGKVAQGDMWKYSSFWYKDFDAMACKTMIRQLIPKYGPMSIEMQTAFESDDAVFDLDKTGNIVTETSQEIEAQLAEAFAPAGIPEKGEVIDLASVE